MESIFLEAAWTAAHHTMQRQKSCRSSTMWGVYVGGGESMVCCATLECPLLTHLI